VLHIRKEHLILHLFMRQFCRRGAEIWCMLLKVTQFFLLPTLFLWMELNHACLCLPSQSRSSFTDPEGMESWVGLGTTVVSKQSADDCYMVDVTVVSCLYRHTSLGKWVYTASPQLLPSSVVVKHQTTARVIIDVNHTTSSSKICFYELCSYCAVIDHSLHAGLDDLLRAAQAFGVDDPDKLVRAAAQGHLDVVREVVRKYPSKVHAALWSWLFVNKRILLCMSMLVKCSRGKGDASITSACCMLPVKFGWKRSCSNSCASYRNGPCCLFICLRVTHE